MKEPNGLGFPKSVRTLAKILVLGIAVFATGVSLRSVHTTIAGGVIFVIAFAFILVEISD